MVIVSRLKGGLGNCLFQIAAGYSLAKRLNLDFAIDKNRISHGHDDYNMFVNNIMRNVYFINFISLI